MPSPIEIMMREKRNYDRPGAQRNRAIRKGFLDLIKGFQDPSSLVGAASTPLGFVTGGAGVLDNILSGVSNINVHNGPDPRPPGGMRTHEAVHGPGSAQAWMNEPGYLSPGSREEEPPPTTQKKPKTAREKKQQDRQINLRRQMWESLGVDPSVARVMAGADVAQMRSRQQNQADEEEEGTLPGTAPPPLDDVGWQPLEEAATETDNMNTIDLFQTVLNAGGQGYAPVGEYWLSEEDVADFLTGNGRPLPGYSAEETEVEIRNALNEQLNMLESGLITPENPSIAPVQPRQYGEDEGNENWMETAFGYTPQGQVLSDVQDWFGEEEGQPQQEETEEAPPAPQVDVNALSEEDKEALYQVIAPMWSTYTDEEMPPRDELIQLFFDTWYTQESVQ